MTKIRPEQLLISNTTAGMYAVGNTTGQSSNTTFDMKSISISGAGIASVGYSGNNIIINVPAAGALINVSAGTTSGNVAAITFSNSNGVSFGLNNGVVTATVVPGGGGGGIANQAGTQTATSGTVIFSNSNGISFGMSNSSIVTASYTVPTLTSLNYSNSNNVSFGINGSTLTATATFSQTNQTQSNVQGISAGTQIGQTGNIVFSNSNGISFGMSNSSVITASYTVPTQTAQTQNIVVPSAGTQTATSGTVSFVNSNGISFGMSGSNQITASYTVPNVPAQTNQTVGLYALGNTTQNSSTTLDARTLSFNGLGAATVGYSNGSIQISVPTQTAFQLSNSNGISFGTNGSTVTANYTVPSIAGLISGVNLSAGTTSNNLTAFTMSNSNGLSFGLSGSVVTASYTVPNVPTQTNQTIGLYALGNTTQNSSTTLDARTLSFNGLGAATVGYSNGSIQVSVPTQTIQTQNIVVPSAGTQTATSGTVIFSNSNGISFGMSNSSVVTASYTVPSTAGLISNINFSAGTTSNNLSALTFSNSNGISFGLNGSTITASYTVPNTAGLLSNINISAGTTSNNLSALTFSNSNGLSFGLNGSTITGSYTVPIQTNQTEGLYAIGNTAGQSSSSTFDARTLSFSGAGIASVGYSGNALVISVPSAGALVNISAGTTSNNLGAVTFSNSNNVSFGLNGSTITASIPNQTLGLYALGNTVGQSSSSTFDARTLSFSGAGIASVGYSGGNIIISVPSAGALVNFSAGTTSNNLGAVTFSNSNNVSFGLNGSTITASIPTQTNQTIGLYALGNTTQNSSTTLDARTLSFNGLGAATVGYSNGSIQISVPTQTAQTQSLIQAIYDGANSITTGTVRFTNANGVSFSINGQTISGSVAAQTNQTIGLYALGNTTQNSSTTLDARTLSFNGLGNITVGYSNGSIQISGAGGNGSVNISAGTTSNNLTNFVFSNSNNVSFGLNGSTVTATITVPTQTNQTIGLYALGNTTQNSSTTLDARTLSFNGLGIITAGYSNGSIQISATQSAQTQNIVVPSAGTQTATSGTVIFSNSNGISFGMSNSSVITASYTVPTQTNQTVGLYALGNTTQNSSTTLDARTLSFNGLGAATVGYSNGSIQISVPVQTAQTQSNIQAIYDGANSISTGTIRFTNANGVSFSVNGQTISASIAARKVFQLGPDSPWQTNFSLSNASFSLQHFIPRADIIATQANFLMALSGNTGSTGALTISLGAYTMAGSTMSLVSSASRQITWTSGSQSTNSTIYGGISGTCYRTVSLGSWNFTAGDYMLGVWCRTTNDGTWNVFGTQGPSIVNANDVNETQAYLPEYFSTGSFSTAMVASINLTDTNYVRTGTGVLQQPSIILIGTV